MTEIRRGAVYYVDKTDDQVGSEQYSGRPAIIVSNNYNNRNSGAVEIVYLTSQQKKDLPTHVHIPAFMGVPRDSIALCEQITTVSKARLGNLICILPERVMEQIDQAMMVSLGILNPGDGIFEEDAEEIELAFEDFTEQEKALIYQTEGAIYKNLYYELLDKIIKR